MPEKRYSWIDFHTHIIPGVDDGSASPEMSAEMLELLKSQGVQKVVLTPHYYRESGTVDEFCNRRDKAFLNLMDYINKNASDVPEMIVASEVKLSYGMNELENLDMLCVSGTKVILLEMPYEKWSDWMYNEIYALCAKGYIPVMVHIERYLKIYASADDILKKLLGMRVFVQCNLASFREMRKRKLINSVIKTDKLFAFGTDCHNVTSRKPDFDIVGSYIMKKYGIDFIDEIMYRSSLLISGKIIEYI